MTAMRFLMVAVLVSATSGQNTQYVVQTEYGGDSTCSGPHVKQRVWHFETMMRGSPMDGAVNGCVHMNGTYMKIVDCFMEMHATSDCTGTPVHRQEFHFDGCQETGDSGGSYVMNECSISRPPSAIDMTCMTLEDAEAGESEPPNCVRNCGDMSPSTCSEGVDIFSRCARDCGENEVRIINTMLKMHFGCSCNFESGTTSGTVHTCGAIRQAYKDSKCCGNPNSPFEFPMEESTRRLGSGHTKFWRPFPRGLGASIPTQLIIPEDVDEVTLRSIKKTLDKMKQQSGAAKAKILAMKINTMAANYL